MEDECRIRPAYGMVWPPSHLMSHNPFPPSLCLCDRMSFEWPGRPAQHFSEARGRFIRIRITFPQCLGIERGTDRTFCKICLKGTGLKDRHLYVWRVTFWAALFASHVLEKLDSELQQQKGAFVGSRGVCVLISSFSPHGAKDCAELKRALAVRCMAKLPLAGALFTLGLPSKSMCPFDERYQQVMTSS